MVGSRKTYVAVVEDDESLCRAMGRLLRAQGLHPVTYTSAEALLEDGRRPRFECLLLDIRLPGMSGIELCRHLASSGSTAPAIFLTATADETELREEAMRAHGVAYLRKTAAFEVVLAAIRTAINESPGGATQ